MKHSVYVQKLIYRLKSSETYMHHKNTLSSYRAPEVADYCWLNMQFVSVDGYIALYYNVVSK